MTLRSTLSSTLKYAALGAGFTVAATRALRAKAGELEPPLDGRKRTSRWRGMDIAYTEAGDEDDETVVLLHGINAAGSAGEWREVFADLADEYHVVAPDLPGFGRSDRPPLRYSAALYEDFVRDFLTGYDGQRVVASSLTAAYVVGVADGLDLADLTLVCPTAVAGPDPPKPAVRELIRAPIVGDAVFGLLASKPSIAYFNADHGYWDPEKAGDDWPDYEWRTTHQENARFAPASFVSGFLNSDVDLANALAALDVPTTIVWGREADLPPLAEGRDLADAAGCELVVFDDAMLLPHVEFGDQFVGVVAGERPDATVTVEQEDGG
ncbi:alpha/beta fold hydrolase [Halobaculum gomorrense]|uniref:Pimeloyl-ACP methyl ester carboxylesterase n=1 Tax=Halobaculum gomorrense TaxID=43928 RepID=A0A1M5KI33_9EURY|nr:alpha/beta hydrolase [Halobaculum gomorrense]SHG52427.1 Pimeloyl-ACP methyl ester carboxylesterase [Halobaculum gomorrense]